jgi:hypothetical protein
LIQTGLGISGPHLCTSHPRCWHSILCPRENFNAVSCKTTTGLRLAILISVQNLCIKASDMYQAGGFIKGVAEACDDVVVEVQLLGNLLVEVVVLFPAAQEPMGCHEFVKEPPGCCDL